ncbi:MAG: CHAT domain-containing protein [Deltaproteobacteria bacterium]|nr:CHAT domain-containing protein [Deltaproteobacteria bacterium]
MGSAVEMGPRAVFCSIPVFLACALAARSAGADETPNPQAAAAESAAGGRLIEERQYALALSHFVKAHALAPDDDRYPAQAAVACWWLARHDDARTWFRKAIRLAASRRAFERIDAYQQMLLQLHYTMPDWANARRQKAGALPERPGVAQASAEIQPLLQRATALLRQGELDAARPLANQAVRIAEQHFGPSHLQTLMCLNTVADLHRLAGEPQAAEKTCRRVVAAAEKALGPDHPDTLVYWNNLASALDAQGDHMRAREIFERTAESARGSLGPAHPITLTYMNNLANALGAQGDLARAQDLLEQAWRQGSALLGDDHPYALSFLSNLADVLAQRPDRAVLDLIEQGLQAARRTLAPSHPVRRRLLQQLGEHYASRDRLDDLERLHEHTLDELRRYEPGSDLMRTELQDFAELLAARGRWSKAERVLKELVELEQRQKGAEHRDSLAAQSRLADLYLQSGNYSAAQPVFDGVLGRSRKLLGSEHPDTLVSMSNLGLLLAYRGAYAEARPLLDQASEQAQRALGVQDPVTLSILNNRGLLASLEGQYDRARSLYENVLEARSATQGDEHPETLRAMQNLALVCARLGLYARAQLLIERSLHIRRRVLGAQHPDTLRSMNALGLILDARGDYAAAQPVYEKSYLLRSRHLGASHPDTLASMGNLAFLYRQQGRYDKARRMQEEALSRYRSSLGKNHPRTLEALTNLAVLYWDMGLLDQAAALVLDSYRTRQVTLGSDHPDTLEAQNNLAELCRLAGQLEDAERLLRACLAGCAEKLGRLHPTTLTAQGNLARVIWDRGDHRWAVSLIEETAKAEERLLGPLHPESRGMLRFWALMLAAEKQHDASEKAWQKHLRRTTRFLDRVLWSVDEHTRQSYLAGEQLGADGLLSFCARHTSDRAALLALEYALARKGLLLRVASEIQATARAQRDPVLSEMASRLAAKRREMAEQSTAALGASPQIESRIDTLQAEIEELESRLGRSVAQIRRASVRIEPAQLIEALGGERAYVEYLHWRDLDFERLEYTQERLMALVVNPRHKPVMRIVCLGPMKPISQAVQRFREACGLPSRSAPKAYIRAQATKLYALLWAPLREALGEKTKIYLVPDDVLHLLPFAALQDPEGRYLVEKIDLALLSSGRDLVLGPWKAKAAGSAIFASPHFDFPDETGPPAADARTSGKRIEDFFFPPLPGSAREGEQVLAHFRRAGRQARIFTGVEASEKALASIARPRILHLATHGFILDETASAPHARGLRGLLLSAGRPASPTQPALEKTAGNPMLRSGLAMTGANRGVRGTAQDDGSDGLVTALEVLALDLAGTELVTLSACQTGLGHLRQGQGIYGLRRAFLEAGARAVLSTLWSIHDQATREFMDRFYSELCAGRSPQEALASVQREFIASERHRHPFFWAPFAVVGP